jgi:hypothetical protein
MIFEDIEIDYDHDLVMKEILSCRDLFVDIPPYQNWIDLAKQRKIFMVESKERYDSITVQNKNVLVKKSIHPPQSFYIKSSDAKFQPYSKSKKLNFDNSTWNFLIGDRLKYTKFLIENLPFEEIGLVRVFILENTFLPTHHDKIICNINSNLGISLVPIHSGSPLMIYDRELDKIESVFSSAFLFDDSNLHGIPMVNGLRIDIRIFGKFNNTVNLG